MERTTQRDTFSRFTQVSRETITSLEKYEKILIKANKNLNLIGKSTVNEIWTRHFLDSAQVIDFIDKNDKSLIDIGSGAGFPGLVLAILAKDKKIPLKISLVEKSSKKVKFLKQTIQQLNLNVQVHNVNLIKQANDFSNDVFVARAFKPLEITLKLMHKRTSNLKKFFVFMGKSGHAQLLQASKSWDIEYKQRMSLTSNDSIILEINKFRKK